MGLFLKNEFSSGSPHAVQKAAENIPAEVCARFESADRLSDEDRTTIIEIARQALAPFQPKPEAKADQKPEPASEAKPKSESTPKPEPVSEPKATAEPHELGQVGCPNEAGGGTQGSVMSDTTETLV